MIKSCNNNEHEQIGTVFNRTEFSVVNKAPAEACHPQKMKLVPGTVNDIEKMKSLIADGLTA